MSDGRDYLALDWVRGEIQETLNEAQHALESYVDNTEDSSRIRFCLNYIHQVRGTLQMVEFYGAALLAEEMEALAQALLDGKVADAHHEDAHEVLMRAILQMPPYLDRIQASRRDMPVVLLPLLNDLRAARGASLMSETSLFKPDLESSVTQNPVPVAVRNNKQIGQITRKIRQMYQVALLGVLRDEKTPESFGFMARVFERLSQMTGTAAMRQLWMVASALVEGMSAGHIVRGASVKSLLAHLDRVLREVTLRGVDRLEEAPPRDLLKNILYYVAKADAETPRIRQVRQLFSLEDALPSEQLINEERARMSGPDRAAMASVVAAIAEELDKVKTALDVFVHQDGTDPASLKPQVTTLKQVSDTIAVLGLGKPRQLVDEQLVIIEGMISNARPVSSDVLMDVAGALLYVEASLEGFASGSRTLASSSEETPDHIAHARDAVLRESRAGLEEAKEGIVEYIASQWDQQYLMPVPERLVAVRGGLEIIGLSRAANVLVQCVSYISERLLDAGAGRPEWQTMDTLADAISGVEYYLERLSDDLHTQDKMLDTAVKRVAELGYPIAEEQQEIAEAPDARLPDEVSIAAEAVEQQESGREDTELPGISEAEVAELPADEAVLSEEAGEIPADAGEQQQGSTPEVVEASADGAASDADDENDLIDDEIIEIFVEEVEEVLETLNEHFPRWAADQNDETSLVEFRRAFHTLKGSGRMVGATTCGELAWSIENMLNRVIDKTIQPNDQLVELVRAVHGLIQPLVDAFASRQPDPFDVTALREAADTLAAGGTITEIPRVGSTADVAEEPEDEPASTAVTDSAEPQQAESGGLPDDEDILHIDETAANLDTEDQHIGVAPVDSAAGVASDADFSGDLPEDEYDGDLELVEDYLHPVDDEDDQALIDDSGDFEADTDFLLEEDEASGEGDTGSLAELAGSLEEDDFGGELEGLELELSDEAELSSELSDIPAEEPAGALSEKDLAMEDSAQPDEAQDSEDDMDPVLLELFQSEAEANIDVVRDWLRGLDPDLREHDVDDSVHRALHTIKGSARMAGIESVAAVAEPAERLVKEIINRSQRANQEAVALFEDTVRVLEQVLEHPRPHRMELDGAEAVITRFHELRDAILSSEKTSVDAHILTVFMSEGMDLILDSEALLERWASHPDNQEELLQLRDELALLAGSADTAGLTEVASLAAALADIYSAVSEDRIPCSDVMLELAHKGHDALINMMDYLAAAQNLRAEDALIADIRAFLEDASPGSEADQIFGQPVLHEEVSGQSGQLSPDSITAGEDSVEPTEDLQAEPVEAVEHFALPPETDPEILEMFLEEADEILDAAANGLDDWERTGASDSVASLQRDLHTLKGGARMAGIAAIGDLAHELENLYEGFAQGRLTASPDLFELLHRCHDRLADMIDLLRGGQGCGPEPALIAAVQQFLAGGGIESVQPPVSGTELPPDAVTDADVPAQDISADIPERDEELVQIFLEEADEILESVGASLENWMQQPDNLIEVQTLQRDLHTLKGGARMAEIRELGDLSHELENLYEGLAKGTLSAESVLFDLLHQCHDRLAVMVEDVKVGKSLEPAADLINAIHAYIRNPQEYAAAGHSAPGAAEAPQESDQPSADDATESVVEVVDEEVPADDILSGDVDVEILHLFIEESGELCELIDESIGAWREAPESSIHSDEIKRALHTLKGGARLAGLKELGDITHDFETSLIDHINSHGAIDNAFFDSLVAWLDRINHLMDRIRKAASGITDATSAAAQQKPQPAVKAATDSTGLDSAPGAAPRPAESEKPAEQTIARAREERLRRQQQPQEMVRVASELLEGLVNLAGETSINRGRVEQELSRFSAHVEEMGNTVERLYGQLRRLDIETEAQIMSTYREGLERGEYSEDFDPLEMDQYSELHQITKQLSESASDLLDLKGTLLDRTRDAETLLLQQSRINTELQEKLMRTRMVPFARLIPRLRRIVRQVSGEVGKRVEFDVLNPEGELDRTLLERIVAPLEHMLRNAVDHGIEAPDGRAATGKDATGRIALELGREGGEVVLILSDDGKGIDTDAVRRKATERGLIDDKSELSEQEVLQFIFNAGFSTAEKVTQLSGRGVGMDVVASEIKQMGGSITIDSKKGRGTRFTIRLPFTLAMNRALMVKVGEDTYAIPLNQIEGIVRVSPYELEGYFEENPPPFHYAGQNYEFEYLGNFVHGNLKPHLDNQIAPLPVLLVRSSEHAVAILLDSLAGSREVVVKSVGPQLSTVAGISGATILGDGSVVIILDIHSLIRSAHYQRQHMAVEDRRAAQAAEHERRVEAEKARAASTPLVMVTDDSVTVRKVTTRLLERNGYEVMTAKDGMDAVARLEDRRPDLMLLDIEMPRMDGFEVAMHMRHDERLKDVPIIMITSRTGEKHRERAFDIGVNCYMGKPFQEGELLNTIQELLAQARTTAGS